MCKNPVKHPHLRKPQQQEIPAAELSKVEELPKSLPSLCDSVTSDEESKVENDHFEIIDADKNEEKDEEIETKEESKEEDDGLQMLSPDWEAAPPSIRRQKRRQRQRANAKIGRAIRRFVASKGAMASYYQILLVQAQRDIVSFLDFIFGPMNLPQDQFLNTMILDPQFKSTAVLSIIPFDGVQAALAPLGFIEQELQLAIVVDSLRWSQHVRCGPVCYPDGNIVYCLKVREVPSNVVPFVDLPATSAAPPAILVQPALCICGNCQQYVDIRFGCMNCGYGVIAAPMNY